MLLKLHFVHTLLQQEFILQLFSPYNVLFLKEILENQNNYVTVEVNLAHFQRSMRNFSGPSWRILGSQFLLSFPACLALNMTVLFIIYLAPTVNDKSL